MMYTMMQVYKEADLTYQTLKFYCNEVLIPNVQRENAHPEAGGSARLRPEPGGQHRLYRLETELLR